LHQLPLHSVKLDRSFVASLETEPRSVDLVGAVVAMAQGLGLAVTAEGLETEHQLEIIRELGCDTAQGYLFSAAVEANDLPRIIAEIENRDWKIA
jgi:EAL domain-containing protein (putative c-di-GMP-specific phosphodiesterase class I)